MAKPDKRTEILRAALELIAEHGFHGAPMALIAERAGVAAGTTYCYFESKDVLINELYQLVDQRISEFLQAGFAPGKPVRERFLHVGTMLLRYLIDNPPEFRFLEQFINSPYGAALRRDKIFGASSGHNKLDMCLDLFVEGVAQQVVKDLPLAILTSLFFSPILSVTRDHILGFIELDDALITRTIESCWNSVRL